MTDSPENVVWLDGAKVATSGVPVAAVCSAAAEACEEIVVIGWTKGEGELYVASSFAEATAEKAFWLIAKAQRYLMQIGDED